VAQGLLGHRIAQAAAAAALPAGNAPTRTKTCARWRSAGCVVWPTADEIAFLIGHTRTPDGRRWQDIVQDRDRLPNAQRPTPNAQRELDQIVRRATIQVADSPN
jgi:hypothetical protein